MRDYDGKAMLVEKTLKSDVEGHKTRGPQHFNIETPRGDPHSQEPTVPPTEFVRFELAPGQASTASAARAGKRQLADGEMAVSPSAGCQAPSVLSAENVASVAGKATAWAGGGACAGTASPP